MFVLYELYEVGLIHNPLLTKSYKEYGGSLSKVEKLATGGIFFHFSLSEEVSAQLDKRSDKIEIF